MSQVLSDFHFLRPEWLWAFIPAAIVVAIAWQSGGQSGLRDWMGKVDAHLLRHLMVQGTAGRASRWLVAALAAGLAASVLAMAGPAWERLPTPTSRGADPVVVVLSLSQTMNGDDLVPSRLARAGHKLRDILKRAQGEDVGLVVYADRPFVAAPLTPDAAVIEEMLPELSTSLMPVLGNRLHLAIDEARDLLASAGAARGTILVLADDLGVDPDAALAAARAARKAGYKVSVLGVGTEKGARLQTADGRAIRAGGSEAPIVRLDPQAMAALAKAGGGAYATITPDSSDLDTVLPPPGESILGGEDTDLKADAWHDRGYLLLFIPVLLMPLAFRRGVLFAVALSLAGLSGGGTPAQAAGQSGRSGSGLERVLENLWATPDQKGYRAFAEGRYDEAARAFESPEWAASARYKAGDYEGAAAMFGGTGYNAGNALAKAGRLQEALAAYDAHLQQFPDDEDAKFNRDLVAQLLEQQKRDEEQNKEEDQQQESDQPQNGQQGGEQDQPQNGQQGGEQDQPQNGQQGGEQDQPQNGQQDGEQDQPQNGQQGGEQDQPQNGQQGGEQDQPQNGQQGGEQDQPQNGQQGGEQDQPQNGQQGGEQDQPQNGQQGGAEATDPGQDRSAGGAQKPEGAPGEMAQSDEQSQAGSEPGEEDKSLFSSLIDKMLEGNGAPTDEEPQEEPAQAAVRGGKPLAQAVEQQLRAVPDDPAGLLRARIRQHYARLRANGN